MKEGFKYIFLEIKRILIGNPHVNAPNGIAPAQGIAPNGIAPTRDCTQWY